MSILSKLKMIIEKKGAAYVVLFDPDLKNDKIMESQIKAANDSGVDALFVGGSLMMDSNYNRRVQLIKELSELPIIFFPGSSGQLNSHYDAILFLAMLSGRNPHYLIGEQVISAPIIHDLEIETISTGYILMDGGIKSSVEIISGTRSIPMDRLDVAVAHALAGQYLGMDLIYLEAGSGAKNPVSNEVIRSVSQKLEIPLIVGGGIRDADAAKEKVDAGASIIVTGNAIEKNSSLMSEIADSVHNS